MTHLRRDHPRSRGVYLVFLANFPYREGSSPLARGLPGLCLRRVRHSRIIPARAGFTAIVRRPPVEFWDHPRSRGVYRESQFTTLIDKGSSPLARGLLKSAITITPIRGIIPARAGFTYRHPDHRHCTSGSSPLARGLHRDTHRVLGQARIIPARAGFTRPFSLVSRNSRDHPRSRGVYAVPTTSDQWDEGSSPLARGLR